MNIKNKKAPLTVNSLFVVPPLLWGCVRLMSHKFSTHYVWIMLVEYQPINQRSINKHFSTFLWQFRNVRVLFFPPRKINNKPFTIREVSFSWYSHGDRKGLHGAFHSPVWTCLLSRVVAGVLQFSVSWPETSVPGVDNLFSTEGYVRNRVWCGRLAVNL